jgi:hypothetical protein
MERFADCFRSWWRISPLYSDLGRTAMISRHLQKLIVTATRLFQSFCEDAKLLYRSNPFFRWSDSLRPDMGHRQKLHAAIGGPTGGRDVQELSLDAAPLRLDLPGSCHCRSNNKRDFSGHHHVGPDYQTALGQQRRNATIPQSGQSPPGPYSPPGGHIHPRNSRAHRRNLQAHLRQPQGNTALHPGLHRGLVLLFPERGSKEHCAPPLQQLAHAPHSGLSQDQILVEQRLVVAGQRQHAVWA